jgi:hypothetical protein
VRLAGLEAAAVVGDLKYDGSLTTEQADRHPAAGVTHGVGDGLLRYPVQGGLQSRTEGR